jgi:hypothetical protein
MRLRCLPRQSGGLQRLEAYLAAHHADAIEGDIPATEMALKIIEKQCRLLGLFRREGQQQTRSGGCVRDALG